MYKTIEHTTTIDIETYLNEYVDIPTFLSCCKECPNYNQIWSCPPYTFNVEKYWKNYKTLTLYARQIIFSEESKSRQYTQEELNAYINEILLKEKQILADFLYTQENNIPESISLSAGSCQICGHNNCSKKENKPCRYPDKMRYSIESLGGNVGKTISKLFHIELEWVEEGKLPNYFVLVSGLLKK